MAVRSIEGASHTEQEVGLTGQLSNTFAIREAVPMELQTDSPPASLCGR
jgi:hypothetical protein